MASKLQASGYIPNTRKEFQGIESLRDSVVKHKYNSATITTPSEYMLSHSRKQTHLEKLHIDVVSIEQQDEACQKNLHCKEGDK